MKKLKEDEYTNNEIIENMDFLRNFIHLFFFVSISGIFGIVSYVMSLNSSDVSLLQKPMEFISDLSLTGFGVSGFAMGVGIILCGGGFLHHFLCGIPILSGNSFIIVFLFLVMAGLTSLTKTKTMHSILSTQELYTSELNDLPFTSSGVIVFGILLTLIFLITLMLKAKKLKTLDGKTRGKIDNLQSTVV